MNQIVALRMQDAKRGSAVAVFEKPDFDQRGQTYDGKNLAFKRKCHFYESLSHGLVLSGVNFYILL